MAVILPPHPTPTTLTRIPRTIIPLHHTRSIRCSATAPPKIPRPTSDPPLVIDTKLLNRVASRPPVLNGPTLKSTWTHRAWLTGGCTAVLISLARSFATASDTHTWLEPVLAGALGYVMADLGSGVYHWGIDNYGDAETPVFGSQIEAFQGHHKWPWVITRRQFANNLHALGRVIMLTVLPVNAVIDDPVLLGFVATFSGCIMFSQQFHAWSHSTKSKLPAVVVALQDGGVLVSRSRHAAHHRAPYNNNYCIVSGVWNEVLDSWRFFEVLEMVIFFRFGVRPRSWSDPDLEWTEDSELESFASP